ncbi:MAG: 5'-nucleotidase C-terminal domain-containing protein, partial [Oscillospiraceae bacterium]|nr:5'-nucleotidase C-terminal domain-containing protein [Oscillospiraceae bacterium]
LGGLLSDALAESLGLDVMLLGSGSVRTEQMGPLVVYQDLVECFPYDDATYMLTVTGGQFKRMMQFMLRDGVWKGEHCEFYQLSKRVKIVYDIPNSKILEFKFDDEDLDDDRLLRIGLQTFHLNNFTEFFNVPIAEVDAIKKPTVVTTSTRDVLEEYLATHQHLDREIDGRLTLIR